MKSAISFLAIILFSVSALAQRTLIADNSGNPPEGDHVFPSLQAAVDAAQPSDIIHVVATGLSHGTVTISDKQDLEIYGIGFNPSLSGGSFIRRSYVEDFVISLSTDIKIVGIEITDDFRILKPSGVLSEDILIESVYIRDELVIEGGRNIVVVKSLIRKLFASGGNTTEYSNITYSNNIFSSTSNRSIQARNSSFIGNILVGSTFDNTYYNVFLNNIIAIGIHDLVRFTNNQLINNLLTTTLNIGNRDNTGVDNTIKNFTLGQLYEDPNINGTLWDRFWELTPDSEDVLGQANDGGDLGPTGGSDPYQLTSFSLPAITEFLAPTSVKKGNTFEVTIKAKGN